MVDHIPGIGGQQRSQVQCVVSLQRLVVHLLGVHDGEGVGGGFLLNDDDAISLLIGNGLIRVLRRFLIRPVRVPCFVSIVLLEACGALLFKAEAFKDILIIRHGELLLTNLVDYVSQHDGEAVLNTSGIVLKLRLQISLATPPARLKHIVVGVNIPGVNIRHIVAVHGIDVEILIHGVGNQMELCLCGKQGAADRIGLKRRHHRPVRFAHIDETALHGFQVGSNIGNHVGRPFNPQEVFLQLGGRESGIGDGIQIVVDLLEILQPIHQQLTAPFGKLLLYHLHPRLKLAVAEVCTDLCGTIQSFLLIPLAVRVKQPADLLVALLQGAVVGHIPGVGVFGHIQRTVNAFEMRQLRHHIDSPVRNLNVRLANRGGCGAALLPLRAAVAGKGVLAVGLTALKRIVSFGMLQRFINLVLGEHGGQLLGEIPFGLCHRLLPDLLKRRFAIRNVLQEELFQAARFEGAGGRVEDGLRLVLAKRKLPIVGNVFLLVVGNVLLLIVGSSLFSGLLCDSLRVVQHISDVIRVANQLLLKLVWQRSPHLCGKNIVIKLRNVRLKGHRKAPFVAVFTAFTFNTPQRAKSPALGDFLSAEQGRSAVIIPAWQHEAAAQPPPLGRSRRAI